FNGQAPRNVSEQADQPQRALSAPHDGNNVLPETVESVAAHHAELQRKRAGKTAVQRLAAADPRIHHCDSTFRFVRNACTGAFSRSLSRSSTRRPSGVNL